MPVRSENCDYMTVRLPSGEKGRIEAAARAESRPISTWAWLVLKGELDRRGVVAVPVVAAPSVAEPPSEPVSSSTERAV